MKRGTSKSRKPSRFSASATAEIEIPAEYADNECMSRRIRHHMEHGHPGGQDQAVAIAAHE